MSHIYYFRSYSTQSYAFRKSANPAFLEAVGNAIALSVGSRKYFQCKVKLPIDLDVDCNGSKEAGSSADPYKVLSDQELKLKQTGINFLHYKLLKIVGFIFLHSIVMCDPI